jgi:DNA-binding NarL/FixJ family response regulator
MLLDLEPSLAVVGEAATGCQALELASQLRPDVILADVTLPEPDGIALARQLQTVLPQTRAIIMSMHEDPATMQAAFTAGASGYVIKRASVSQLVDAIHAAVAGQRYVDPILEETQ